MASTRARAVLGAIVVVGALALGGLYVWYKDLASRRQGTPGGPAGPVTAAEEIARQALARKRILASVHYVNSRLEEPRHREEILRAVDDARECVGMSRGDALDRLNLAICLLRQYDDRRFQSTESAPSAGEDWVAQAKPLLAEARGLVAGVVKERPAFAPALFHAAMVEARRGKLEAAEPESDWKVKLTEACKSYLTAEDRSAAVRYHLGTLLFRDRQYLDAEKSLRRAVEIDPSHPNAYYTLGRSLALQEDPNKQGEAGRCFETHRMLQDSIGKQRAQWDPDAVFDFNFPELVAIDLTGAKTVLSLVHFEATPGAPASTLTLPFCVGDPAVVPGLRAAGAAAWTVAGDAGAPVVAGSVGDLDGDHYLDAVLATTAGLAWFRSRGDAAPASFEVKPLPLDGVKVERPVALQLADVDADGDLDLFALDGSRAAGPLVLLRNDAVPASGPADTPPENLTLAPLFRDATASSGLDTRGLEKAVKVLVADFDGDNDVDVCAVAPGASRVFANRRDVTFAAVADLAGGTSGAAGDVDGDGLPDLVFAGPSGVAWARSEGARFSKSRELTSAPIASPQLVLADLENRGELDIVCFSKDRVSVLRRQAEDRFAEVGPALFPKGFDGTPVDATASDLDGDFDLDLVVSRAAASAVVYTNIGGEKFPAAALTFRGTKTNRAGLGTKVEIRAGGLRSRREVWTVPFLAAAGRRPRIDGAFVKWTNGIDEAHGDVPAGKYLYIIEKRGREGSCPFVYSWNGREFAFVTDALGATPLGLYAAPGLYVPPQDHEWLRIRSDQLAPRDGSLDLRFTEEMREATYLDRVRLLCIDHPEGTSVYPDERFSFPPFPAKRVLRLTQEISVARATDGLGNDATDLLRQEDRRFVRPPKRLGYQGMAEEHALELDLGDLTGRAGVRLFLTGWFAWTNSSINRAIAFAGIRFTPPRVDVKAVSPDAPGVKDGWRTVVPDAGFPAGMQKTLCIDLTGKLLPGERVVRLVTNLDLNWDRAFLSFDRDEGDAPFPVKVTELPPVKADLRWRGASRWSLVNGTWPSEPVYADVSPEAVYDLHTGDYTRYGDVLELLDAADDRYAIFHHGDEVALSFDASAAPPPVKGLTRTYFLDSSGWAKDMDPSTFAPETVEPLPFHGMSGYPYAASERYPDTPATRQYRAEWNTRRVGTPRPLPVRAGIEAIHKD